MSLTEFLLARIDEDHRTAIVEASLRGDDPYWGSGESSRWERQITPERLLAECDAKRRIVAHYEGGQQLDSGTYACKFLALPYAEHPDYREEWRP